MTDEQIIHKCLSHLDNYRTISVSHITKNVLKLDFKYKDIRRIRAKILENSLYMEDIETDKDDFARIRFNPDYKEEHWKVRNPIAFELLKCGMTAAFSIIVSLLLVSRSTPEIKQVNSQADTLKALSAR